MRATSSRATSATSEQDIARHSRNSTIPLAASPNELSSMNPSRIFELQGDDIVQAPKSQGGIYAWYYRPRVFSGSGPEGATETISKFINTAMKLDSEVQVRYGLRYRSQSHLDVHYGSERKPAADVIAKAVQTSGPFIKAFVQGFMVPCYSKPLYIGISRNLFQRVYRDHYTALTQYWDTVSPISRFLQANPDASVQDVMQSLGLTHSFAIEARVRKLAPRDLVVFVCPTDDLPKQGSDSETEVDSDSNNPLRLLEQVLQMLADPICGRR